MLAIILSKPNFDAHEWAEKLRLENIETEAKQWPPDEQHLNILTAEANALIIACAFPNPEMVKYIPRLKRIKPAAPIIVMDEARNDETKNQAFAFGADGYFAKPFDMKYIAFELKNMAAKKSLNGNRWLRAFDVWLDRENRFVKRHTRFSALRNKEFSLLEYLMMNKGKILTRNLLLEHVWDRNANFMSNTVDVHINKLRQKIDKYFKAKLIHTIPCVGYFFGRKKEIDE